MRIGSKQVHIGSLEANIGQDNRTNAFSFHFFNFFTCAFVFMLYICMCLMRLQSYRKTPKWRECSTNTKPLFHADVQGMLVS